MGKSSEAGSFAGGSGGGDGCLSSFGLLSASSFNLGGLGGPLIFSGFGGLGGLGRVFLFFLGAGALVVGFVGFVGFVGWLGR